MKKRRSFYTLKQKALAILLALTFVVSEAPMMTQATEVTTAAYVDDLDGNNTRTKITDTYLSDSNTINGWKNYFTADSTEYAGAVWTDKAVFVNGSTGSTSVSGTEIPSEFEGLHTAVVQKENGEVVLENGNIVMTNTGTPYTATVADENFLISMSALGSTKQITGYSALPSDTVFILDLSNSMSNDDLAQMVEATNKAIDKLLGVNNYNRVGVVVYETSSYTLLPIDRYTTNKTATDSNNQTYHVYVELSDNYGQIRTARTTTRVQTTITVTMPTEAQWTTIVAGIPERGNYEQNYQYRNRVANYLETALSESVIGVDINWSNRLPGGGGQNIGSWNDDTWETWLKNVLNNVNGSTTTETTTVYNLKSSAGADVNTSVNVGGATYIQGGINSAHTLFETIKNNNDTAIDTGLIQGGTARIPIAVLMSDGAPTYATTQYAGATNNARNMGNGGSDSISDYLVFPTQLSAAWLKQKMEDYYGREALFYTLGLGIEYAEANRVLNPYYNTTTTVDTWWTNYGTTAQNEIVRGFSYNNNSITRLEDQADGLQADEYRYYVDQYFPADDASDLVAAFDSIVEAIIIQSKYYPTLVEASAHDFDGYLTFEDELGEFMEVKEMEGIVLGDTIYTGHAFLDALNNSNAFGNADTYTDYGNELMKSISERLGITENEARTLLATAWRSGSSDTTGQLRDKNYIGWYGDENGAYLGHWDDELHTEANYPENAKYLNKCYIFQGDLSTGTTTIKGGDMMHIVVQVHEEIETGHQCVIWKIPANLIPLVTYNVSVNTNSLDTADKIQLTQTLADPIRLIYEVGLVDEINDVNLMEIVGAADHNHPVVDEGSTNVSGNTIGYAFYSNRWGEGHKLDGSGVTDVLDPTSHLATVSHFHPSEQNERYYYTEDTLIYSDEAGTNVYKGGTKPTGSNYWHVYRIIEKTGAGTYTVTKKMVPIAAAVLDAEGDLAIQRITDTTNPNNGAWYIPAGQIYQQVTRHQTQKGDAATTGLGKDNSTPTAKGNVTGTLSYYDYPVVVRDTNEYSIYTFLGNNGRLVKFAPSGIKLTKTIDDSTAAGTVAFTFVVTLTDAQGVALSNDAMNALKIYDANGKEITTNKPMSVSGNKATITIENGESLYLMGMPVGTKYTVAEVISRTIGSTDVTKDDAYSFKEVKVNSVAEQATTDSVRTGNDVTTTSTTAQHTVTQYVIDTVEFVNTRSSHAGDLEVEKLAEHPYGDDYVLAEGISFPITIDLGTANASKEFAATGTVSGGNITSVTTNADGKITLNLGHDDSVLIQGIPEGTEYNVTEDLTGMTNWTQVTPNEELTGTIISDTVASEIIVNRLSAVKVDTSNINLEVTKAIDGSEWQPGWEFGFIVERYNATSKTWENIAGNAGAFTVSKNSPSVTILGADGNTAKQEFTAPGDYYYRITEVIPANKIEGITYDTTHRYFYLTVTDTNSDGVLEIAAQNYFGTTVDTVGNTTTIAATFTNYYAQAVAEISLTKAVTDNDPGVELPMNLFEFEFCDVNHAGAACTGTVSGNHLTLKANVGGTLTFPITYTEADVDTEWNTSTASSPNVNRSASSNNLSTAATSLTDEDTNSAGGSDENAPTNPDQTSDDNGGTTVSASANQVPKVGNPQTTSNDDDSSIPAGSTKTKTFTYYLWEKDNGLDGVTYDKSVYRIDVTVVVTKADNGSNPITVSKTLTKIQNTDGTAVAAENQVAVADGVAAFANTFTLDKSSVEAKIKVNKTLEGRNIAKDEFTFELYKTGANFSTANVTPITKTVGNGTAATADAIFALLTADAEKKAGTYYYVLQEKAGTNNAITYDNSVYHITVVVEQGDADGKNDELIVSSITVNERGGAITTYTGADLANISIDFVNTYRIVRNAEVTLRGDKDLTGKTLAANEFEFGLYSDAACTQLVDTAKNVAVSGTFTFDTLVFDSVGTHTYWIKEIAGSDGHVSYDDSVYKVTIAVTDANGDGVLEAKVTNEAGTEIKDGENAAKFANTYTPDPVTITFNGTKRFVDEANADVTSEWPAFTYGLYAADSNFRITNDTPVKTGALTADFSFTMTYPQAGTFYYVLKEVEGNAPSVRYDTAEYHVTVIITDYTGSGVLTPTYTMVYNGRTVTDKEADFTNVLMKQNVDVRVAITKEIDNTTGVDVPYESFQFGLYNDINCTSPVIGADGNALVSTADSFGDASFNFHYDNSGTLPQTHTYYAREIIPQDGTQISGMDYDLSVYKVVIQLEYDGDELNGYDTITKVVDRDGNAIAEANQTVVTANEAVFTNGFNAEPIELAISGTKSLTNKNVATDEFKFDLYEATVQTVSSNGIETITGWTVGTPIDTVKNDENAAFAFDAQSYGTVGTYYYVVKEDATYRDSNNSTTKYENITFDNNEYLVEVSVTANAEYRLSASAKVIAKRYNSGTAADPNWVYVHATESAPLALEIQNVFTPDTITVDIEGTKTLSGNRTNADGSSGLTAGEFTFELYETDETYTVSANAVALKSVTNGLDTNANGTIETNEIGKILFTAETDAQTGEVVTTDRLYFTEPGTRHFVLREVVPTGADADPTITYDAYVEHNIEVKVTLDETTGKLVPAIREVRTGLSTVDITNTYTAKEATATVNLHKVLVNETGVHHGLDGFTFGVYTDENCRTNDEYTGTNVAVTPTDIHGNATATFTFTDADHKDKTNPVTKTYYIKEEAGTDGRITYDTSVYKVDITLSYDASNNLTAAKKVTKVVDNDGDTTAEAGREVTTADFRNVFALTPTEITISGTKTFAMGTWPNGVTYGIELYETDSTGNYATGTLIGKTTVSKTPGTWSFTSANATPEVTDEKTDKLSFSKIGTYYFAVREENGGHTISANQVIVDGAQYVVKVVVSEEQGTGNLKNQVTMYRYGHESATISGNMIPFNNINYTDTTMINIIGKKGFENNSSNGRVIRDGEFDFELYKTDSTYAVSQNAVPYMQTVNEQGTGGAYDLIFMDVPLEMISHVTDATDEHYLVLKEAKTGNPTITYDSTEYRIKVEVKFVSSTNVYTVQNVTVEKYEGTTKVGTLDNAYDSATKTITLADSTTPTFNNSYEPKYATTSINIEKELTDNTGINLSKAGFKFRLYKDADCTVPLNGDTVTIEQAEYWVPGATGSQTAIETTSGTNGKAVIRLRFDDLMYDAAKDKGHVYTYYLKEIADSKPGMTYDETVYEVKVALSYNTSGELVALTTISEAVAAGISSQASIDSAYFHNIYELDPATLVLEGTKNLIGKDAWKDNYVFSLYTADENWTVSSPNTPLIAVNDEKVNASASGDDYDKFVFDNIPQFTKAGNYYFIVKENAGQLGGVTYDSTEYRIQVVVEADDADTTDDDNDGKLDDLVAKATVLVEDTSGNWVTAADGIVFNNSYEAKGSFSVRGTKELTGRDWRNSDSFTFQLFETDSTHTVSSNAVPKAEAKVFGTDTDKAFEFTDVEIVGAGNHYYVIKEKAGNAEAMAYDTREHTLTLNVVDMLDGTLKLTDSSRGVLDETYSFINVYETNPVTISIDGTKELIAEFTDRQIQDGEFSFALHEAFVVTDANDEILSWQTDTDAVKTVSNNNIGFEFEDLTFDREGTYYFAVKEVARGNEIITYDGTEHRVKVVVTDLGDTDIIKDNKANLKAEAFYIDAEGNVTALDDQIAFTNKYNDTKVTINLQKAVTCTGDITHTLGGFKFQVKNVTTDTVYGAKPVSNNNGETSFAITYDENDLDNWYVYEITEVNTGIKDMKYDTTVHTLEVRLVAEDGKLKAELTLDGQPVEEANIRFNNTYNGTKPKEDKPRDPGKTVTVTNIPQTGDSANVILYAGLGIGCILLVAVLLIWNKKKNKKEETE